MPGVPSHMGSGRLHDCRAAAGTTWLPLEFPARLWEQLLEGDDYMPHFDPRRLATERATESERHREIERDRRRGVGRS